MEEIVKVRQLCKSYGEKTAVDNLNLSIKQGMVIGILGANGAGKSTSIECILGTKKADSGYISICGMDPIKDKKILFVQLMIYTIYSAVSVVLLWAFAKLFWKFEMRGSYLTFIVGWLIYYSVCRDSY